MEVGSAPHGSGFRLLSTLYHDEQMLDLWSERHTISTWLAVESALAQAQADVGLLTQQDADAISGVCRVELVDADALWKAARTVGYPILPLVRQIAQQLPPGPDGRIHYGTTTQDIMDTALAIQLVASTERLVELAVAFAEALSVLATAHASTVMAARTHAQQAVPTTFGAKIAVFLAEVTRHLDDLTAVRSDVAVVSLFGAGGTNAAMGEHAGEIRARMGERLGLVDTAVPWHVARDRIARFGHICSRLAATCVRFAREIVDLSRSEIGEVREESGHLRGASSTMPQKVNPITSESVVGYGVAVTGAAGTLLRAMEAGHERAAGEWQIEWLVVPEVAEYTAAALMLSAESARSLQVFPDAMRTNLSRDGGLLMSEALMMKLAPTMGRERAHDLVYWAAAEVRVTGGELVDICARELTDEARASIGPLTLDPLHYTGHAAAVVDAAVDDWSQARRRLGLDDRRHDGGPE